jgi:type IX secretion system PorP/SprF family membrane protein
MNKYKLLLLGLLLLSGADLFAQDPQFSQYYANPLYLNPALTGNGTAGRAGVNFRQQWPSIDATFTTYTAYIDNYFADYSSGVGAILMHDRQGLAGMQSTSLHLQYAYQLPLTRKLTLRPGMGLGVIERRLDYSNLQFADQFNGSGFNAIGATSENLAGLDPFYQFDLNLGGMLYTPRLFVGLSANHLNRPGFSFNDDSNEQLPVKYSVHGGYRIALRADAIRSEYDRFGRQRSITPTFEYKMQREFKQLSLGAYLTWEPLVVGLWYRGLPISAVENVRNKNESAIVMIGLMHGKMNMGYSFDYTLSSLSMATGGAHEVSLVYNLQFNRNKKPPPNVRVIPCPDF